MSTSRPRGTASLHERALLRAAQDDDRPALEELLRGYEPMIGAIVAALRLPAGCERADIAQEARLGLLRAIRAWQPERGPFRAFATICARNQALSALDAAGARKHQLLSRARSLHDHHPHAQAPPKPLTTPVSASNAQDPGESEFCAPLGDQLSAVSTDTDPLRIVIAGEQINAMLTARQTLTAREQQALTGMLNDKSQRQIAAEHGLSRKAVMRAQRSARHKLAAQHTLAA
jgi:RNA polymerase sporulation-specific sigma factor